MARADESNAASLTWIDRSRLGPATDEQIEATEAEVGHRFPLDVRTALLEHQGMKPQPNSVVIAEGRPRVEFGVLRSCVPGHPGNIAESWQRMRRWGEDPYPKWLVPITKGRGATHFALDYSRSEERPGIVLVDPDVLTSDPEFTAFVAASFPGFLQMLE